MSSPAADEQHAPVRPTPISLNGHLGHLTAEQQKLYDDFHAKNASLHSDTLAYLEGLDRARSLKTAGREATPEELAALRAERESEYPYELLRFLRASKWKPEDALTSYVKYLTWRREQSIDSILDELPFNGLLLDRAVGNNAAGSDKLGRPMYIEKSGGVLTDPMLTCFTDQDIVRSHLWQQENSCRRASVLSAARGTHIELFTNIVDLTGLSSSTQRAIKYTKMLFAVDSAYYPERLGDLYVVHAPWIFPVIWAIVKGWIDPVTRAKIHVVKGDPREVLLAAIEPDQLPSEYGGSCNRCLHSPNCARQFKLEEFAELLPLKLHDPAVQALLKAETIKAGKGFKHTVEVEADEVVEWAWTQEGKGNEDIDWSVTFQPAEPAGAEPVPVVATCRVERQGVFLPQCSWQAPSKGQLTLFWDNHYSWMATKNIKWLARKIPERRVCLGDQELARRVGERAAAGLSPGGAAALSS